MKKNIFLSLILLPAISIFIFSCCSCQQEVGPKIVPFTSSRNVLIEESTGVQCTNCPQGHAISESLSDANPGRIEIVCIHTGSLAYPFNSQHNDFRTTFGDAIDGYLGGFTAQPQGAIDQKIFPGETVYWLDKNKWAGYVTQELQLQTKVNLDITNTYDSTTRVLTTKVHGKYLETFNAENNLSVMLTESDIIDWQDNSQPAPVHIDSFYHHNHVLRMMLTPFNGEVINPMDQKRAGDEFTRTYSYTIPATWNANHCRVVAFLAETGTVKEVYNVVGKNVK